MSDQHPAARPVDPLDALRAIDRRPTVDIWRERLHERIRNGVNVDVRRVVTTLALCMVAVAITWQLFATSDPPVEASIPLAVANPEPESRVDPNPLPSTDVGVAAAVESEETPSAVVVHVAGEVKNPGLVIGVEGWRVDDAISAAGGETPSADLDRLNLAALIADGQRIFVPAVGEGEPAVVLPDGGGTGDTPDTLAVVDINAADVAQLQTLPGIGPATASTIVSHRTEYGNFADVDALVAVRGIGPATLEALREHVRAG